MFVRSELSIAKDKILIISLKQQVQVLEKALELACNDTSYLITDLLTNEYYINKAKNQIKE